jgi:DNA recombination protein RmuC
MDAIIYLALGILVGGALEYFILKYNLTKNFISRKEFEALQSENVQLKIDLSGHISKEELSNNYISKDLHEAINNNLIDAKRENEDYKKDNLSQQEKILMLTSESEQKLSKEEVSRSYVPKESFEIVRNKLSNAEDDLEEKDRAILGLSNQVTELRSSEEALNEKLTTFHEEIEALHDLSKVHFKNLANDVLEEKKKTFIGENKKELNTILDPLKTDLNQFKDKIEATRKEDIQDITSLKKEIESLQKLGIQLSDDAKGLTNALKADVRVQGNWGEDRLKMILESEGLQKYIDYKWQENYRDEDEERSKRPDFILNLPNGKHIIIDSKVSLTAYVNYFNAATPEEKVGYLKQHLKSINDHIDFLSDKNYQSLSGINSPDYVFMFMPIESAITLARNENPELFDRALNKKIVLITPTTLVATLKIIKIIWQKENQVKNVEEIFRQCGLLYDKFVTFIEEMDKIGTCLNNANRSYKEAMDRLKDGARKGDTIIGRFETIRKLEAKTNKSIPPKFITEIELLDTDSEIQALEPDKNLTEGIENNNNL